MNNQTVDMTAVSKLDQALAIFTVALLLWILLTITWITVPLRVTHTRGFKGNDSLQVENKSGIRWLVDHHSTSSLNISVVEQLPRIKVPANEHTLIVPLNLTVATSKIAGPAENKVSAAPPSLAVTQELSVTEMPSKPSDKVQLILKRKKEQELSNMLQKRLQYLQYPSNCSTAKILVLNFRDKYCGFGCTMHNVAFCFIIAYATGRTLVLDKRGWRYPGGWESAFLPISNCSVDSIEGQS